MVVVTLDSRNRTVTDNDTGHFVTRFPKPLELGRDWEVALWEIWYPKTWWTVPIDSAFFLELQGEKIVLPPGYYPDPQTIVDYLNRELERRSLPGKLRYLPNRNRIEVVNGTVELSPMLSSMLGYDPSKTPCGTARWEVDLHNGIHHLFVYSDAVAPCLVGDTVAPLVRAPRVRTADPFGSVVYIKFRRPHFLPLQRTYIDTVEILIADEFGRQVAFRDGSVRVTLLFRKRHV